MMLQVRCPTCKNKMKTDVELPAGDKRKQCVYCGKSFGVRPNVISVPGSSGQKSI